MADEKTINYSGDENDVSWRGSLCIHIGECGRAKGDLFVGGRQPWCQPDLATGDEVKEVILRCPTGALSVTDKSGKNPETASLENTAHVAYNGPLFVRGDLDIEGASTDVPGLKFRAALCRCGQSKNKPYCDNSHEVAKFKDFGAIGDSGDANVEQGGSLKVRIAKNGPLLVNGNLSMSSASGRRSWHGTQAALCRCGASENKPFCDGSHVKAKFNDDE